MADDAIVGCFFLNVAILLFHGAPIIGFDGAKSYYEDEYVVDEASYQWRAASTRKRTAHNQCEFYNIIGNKAYRS
jgi:hypothetical protein